jgi:hypothetical protein
MSVKLFFNKGRCRDRGPLHCGGVEHQKTKY